MSNITDFESAIAKIGKCCRGVEQWRRDKRRRVRRVGVASVAVATRGGPAKLIIELTVARLRG